MPPVSYPPLPPSYSLHFRGRLYLRAREDDGFAEVLHDERERARRVAQRVRAVQNHERVELAASASHRTRVNSEHKLLLDAAERPARRCLATSARAPIVKLDVRGEPEPVGLLHVRRVEQLLILEHTVEHVAALHCASAVEETRRDGIGR